MAALYRFGDFELDKTHFELRSEGRPVPVEPLVFDLIALLAEQPGEVVSRDALIERVWSGRIVSESTISTAIKSARKALGDSGSSQRYIRTVRGRGVQFVAEVTAGKEPQAVTPSGSSDPVLYVRVDGGDVDGAAVERLRTRLATVLARIPMLRIATPFPEADAMGDPRALRREIGATLLLQARLGATGEDPQADVSLTETAGGLQLWAALIEDGSAAEGTETLLHRIVAQAEPRIVAAMIATLKYAEGPGSARRLLLEAAALLALKGWNGTTFSAAERLLEDAAAAEPDLALTHALMALVRALSHRLGAAAGSDAAARAIAAADRALALDSGDSAVLGLAGCALSDAGEIDRAVPILRRAIALDPANAQAKTALGAALMARRDFNAAAD